MKVWLWIHLGNLFLFITIASEKSCAKPLVALAQKWRNGNSYWVSASSLFARRSILLEELWSTAVQIKTRSSLSLPRQTCCQSWVPPHQAWELPLPRASQHIRLLLILARTKSIQLNKNYQSPQTYSFLVCFLLSFFPDLLSNIWPEVRLLINRATSSSFTRAMEGPYFSPLLSLLYSVLFLLVFLFLTSLL